MPPRGAGFDAEDHEKHHWWRSLLLRFAICGAVTALLWWAGGWPALLVTLMLWARAFASDLVALGETLGRALKELAFRPVQGRFYQFKGHRIRVLDDDIERQRWIALADLATALGSAMPAASAFCWTRRAELSRNGCTVIRTGLSSAWHGSRDFR